MNQAIKGFLDANTIKRRSLVKCGFELETQHTEAEVETDYDSASEAISEQVDEVVNDGLGARLSNLLSESVMDSIREEVREGIENDFNYSDYETTCNQSIENAIGNCDVEVVDDSSISGVEIRTIGGLGYLEFVQALRDSFKLEHRIDKKCSFHIHLSIPTVQHTYGERFQLALVEYLVESIPRLPETVQSRFKSAPSNQYIKGLTSSRDKYSFVKAHSLNTWEFRCFGNVQNVSEGIACLNVAIDAMAYAYTCTKLGKPLMTDTYDGDITALLTSCLESLTPVSTQLRSYRKSSYNNQNKRQA